MDTTTIIIIAIIVLSVGYFVWRKRQDKPTRHTPPVHTPHQPSPSPGPTPEPSPGPQPTVLIDRNGRRPGDAGYDPRIDRPADEFSPVEPVGSYYGEGAFNPNGRWIGPDGVHYP